MKTETIKLSLDDDILGPATFDLKVKVPDVKAINRSVQRQLDDDDPLEDIIQRAIQTSPWFDAASVVMIDVQECDGCGSKHEFCHGWFTEHTHRSDAHARQYTRGKSHKGLPLRVHRVNVGHIPVCGDCAESQILIEEATNASRPTP